jgi:ABC-type molybdenum transport system ATPase subunit/photorepair protein PhrA
MPPVNKRLRIMAGPNGSGKSSILRAISEQFYTGPYINADEIQKAFITKGFIELSEFQVAIQPHSFNKYLKTQSETWRDKSLTAGHQTSLRYSMGKLMVESDPSPYDAAIILFVLRARISILTGLSSE